MSNKARGLVYSFVGAALAVLLWYLLEKAVMGHVGGREIAIAVLAGLGALLGYPERDFQGGIMASGATFSVVLATKLVAFWMSPAPPAPPSAKQRAVAVALAHEMLDQR